MRIYVGFSVFLIFVVLEMKYAQLSSTSRPNLFSIHFFYKNTNAIKRKINADFMLDNHMEILYFKVHKINMKSIYKVMHNLSNNIKS